MPKVVKYTLTTIFLLAIPTVLYLYVFGTVIKPYEIGVRKNAFNIPFLVDKGYANQGLQPGWHLEVPGFSEVIILRRNFQFVQLNNVLPSYVQGTSGDFQERALLIPTGDGARVETDMTIVARVSSTSSNIDSDNLEKFREVLANTPVGFPPFATNFAVKTGGPGDLIKHAGELQKGQLELFTQTAKGELREELSALSSTDFYNPALREKAVLEAHEKLKRLEAKNGLIAWATLLRRYLYEEEKIDNQIFAKNLQEQTEQLNSAKKELAAAEAKTEEARALWDAKIRNLAIDGDTQADVLKSEGALYKEQKVAEADLMIKTSEADIDRKRSQLYANVEGADVYLAREMAPILRTLGGGVISNLDPYNLADWIEKLTGGPSVKQNVVNQ